MQIYLFEVLLENKADVNFQNVNGNTALFDSAKSNLDCTLLLLKFGKSIFPIPFFH